MMKFIKRIIPASMIALYMIMGYPEKLNAQTSPGAYEYMTSIENEYKEIVKDTWSYVCAVAHGKSARKVEKRRKNLMQTNMEAQRNIRRMRAYEDSGELRDSVVSFLRLSYDILNEDYAKIVDMEEIAEQSYDMMEAYLMAQDLANDKLEHANKMLIEQQEVFAERYNINLVEGKSRIGQKMQKAKEVIRYYNVVYLVFYKSYKQEGYLLEALEKRDVNALEQNKNALISCTEEGLAKLDTMSGYRGDKTVIASCRKMLEFLNKEATDKVPGMIDFYLLNEKFEKMKAAFEAKRESDRTQEDIDKYNESVTELNNGADKFNETNQKLFDERDGLFKNWNKTVQSFMDEHVPKY